MVLERTEKDIELIDEISSLYKTRCQWLKAQMKLELQAQAICRGLCDGDKKEAGELWKRVKKGDDTYVQLVPFLSSIDEFTTLRSGYEKRMIKVAKNLDLAEWAQSIPGFGMGNFTYILGSLADRPANYRSISAVWKRMGLAVIEGERQRRVAGNADLAIAHGYNAERRATAFVLSECLLRQGEKNVYRPVYDRAKQNYLDQDKILIHAHKHGMRLMVKEALKQMWIADRRFCGMSLSDRFEDRAGQLIAAE